MENPLATGGTKINSTFSNASFQYQPFENNEDAIVNNHNSDSSANPIESGEPTDFNSSNPRYRKGVIFTDNSSDDRRPPNGYRQGEDDEVEECQIRTYGGPITKQDFRTELRKCCSLATLQKRLPISLWLPRYSLADLTGDLASGLTVGLTIVPQALAFAQIADLPLEYGLYSSFMGPFMYTLFGTSKDIAVGPTSIVALLTSAFLPHRADENAAVYATVLAFFCGCFQLLMGLLHLGFLINFVSTPVMSGFTTAACIIIILGQLKGLLGVTFGRSRDNIFYMLRGYAYHMNDTKGWDVLLGMCCIAAILLLKSITPLLKWEKFRSKGPIGWRILREFLKVICYGRYAIVVIIATAVAAGICSDNFHPVTMTKDVKGGLPPFTAPDFQPDNKTFLETVNGFGAGLVLVPVISLFESIVVAKAFSHKFNYVVDPTQEFIALGICNIMGSFVSAFPIGGAFSRSAINAESGARTPLGGIVTGIFVLIAMSALSPVLHFIPKAALSAVIISAIVVMIDFKIFRDLWRINRIELIPLCFTLLLCLFLGVEYGLPLGIGISILMLVYPLARPLVTVEYRRTYRREKDPSPTEKKVKPKFNVSLTPHSALYFPSAEFFKDIFAKDLLNPGAFRYGVSAAPDFLYETIIEDPETASLDDRRGLANDEKLPPIVFNGIHLLNTDYSTVRTMRNIVASCRAARRDLVFINTSHELMRLVQQHDHDMQMERVSTSVKAVPFVIDPTETGTNSNEDVGITSNTTLTPSYSSLQFPGTNSVASDLHEKL